MTDASGTTPERSGGSSGSGGAAGKGGANAAGAGSEGAPDRRDASRERTLSGRPRDPNKLGADWQFPPGVDPEDAIDPGKQTPGAPPVDNRS